MEKKKRPSSFYRRGFFSVCEQAVFLLEGHIKRCVNQSPIFNIYIFFPNIYKMIIKIKRSLPFIQLRLMFLQDKT